MTREHVVLLMIGLAGSASAAACSAGTGGADTAAVAWTTASDVSAASGGGAAPVFARSGDGDVALAWVGAPKGGADGRLYVRPAVTRDSVVEVRDSLGSLSIYGEVPPKIAFAPDGELYAAYLVTKVVPGERWPQNALRFARSADGGHHWRVPLTVTATAKGDSVFGSYDDHALHVASDGTIYLSWLALTGDSSHTYLVRSSDHGATWTRPIRVDEGASCPCCRTSLASAPDGSLYAAWRKIYPGSAGQKEIRDIAIARSTDHGATWSAPSRVHADEWHVTYCPDAGPSVKVGANGVVHVAWWTGKEGAAGVQYAQSRDRGATFSTPVPLGLARFSRAAHVQLAIDTVGTGAGSPTIMAVWDDGTLQTPQIVARLSRDDGKTFGERQVLSAASAAAGYPVVAFRGDSAVVAWQERPVAAATADSARHAKMDPGAAATYINDVGALHVVARAAAIRRNGARS